ncbi:MAG: hypothetical protein ACK56I_30715, partial [bacterium]
FVVIIEVVFLGAEYLVALEGVVRQKRLFRVRLVQEHADVIYCTLVEVLDSLDYLAIGEVEIPV